MGKKQIGGDCGCISVLSISRTHLCILRFFYGSVRAGHPDIMDSNELRMMDSATTMILHGSVRMAKDNSDADRGTREMIPTCFLAIWRRGSVGLFWGYNLRCPPDFAHWRTFFAPWRADFARCVLCCVVPRCAVLCMGRVPFEVFVVHMGSSGNPDDSKLMRGALSGALSVY